MTVDELKALYLCPTDTELADKLEVSRQAVHKWRKRGWVPHERRPSLNGDLNHDPKATSAERA